ncbi:nucleotidyltransferase domain-containing protein [candidate division WOR-3 bacterium]|uniref:Nucleotidyltransferase domain-containing protein n=1 Tax=candidate division WOR-3 bacterium TaxID=2052148 RepID=A0A937XKN3_UNCW3|nr:nucleotidyltransferase domain-containing protein [candidate division WOR-3 bacterium]
MSRKIRSVLNELRRRLKELYGDRLVKLVLFGSQARGDADSDSDIDVLVVLKGRVAPGQEIERTGEIVSGISLEHDVVVSCVYVSDERYRSEWTPLFSNVRREGVAV